MDILSKEEQKKGVPDVQRRYLKVTTDIINPKSINEDEMYGCYDDAVPPNWVDGILSAILKKMCESKGDMKWMVLDGPVDTLWIESLNSVLDDSKLLTLVNGDRISLSSTVRLLFEVENLSVASPATVSRAGMVFMDIEELGWEPAMTMWISEKTHD
jgi:dynein heavy chain